MADLNESLKNRLIFSFSCTRKIAGDRKKFPSGKNDEMPEMPDYQVKI
jgi:hypothetical protein